MTEKDTQSENKVVDIQFLKLRRRLWIMTAVSSFIGGFYLNTESGGISRSP